jgi:signal transduction histidine kinase/PAS domain-containing protein
MRVLLCDSDSSAAAALQADLNEIPGLGPVDVAPAWSQALELLEAHSYAIVLWDLLTPGGSGLVSLSRLRELAPGAVLVALASPSLSSLLAQAPAHGADARLLRAGGWQSALVALLAQAEMLVARRRELLALQERVANLERQSQAFLDSQTEGLLVLSDSGYLLMANPAAAEMLGVVREELVGKHFGEYLLEPNLIAQLLAWSTQPTSAPPASGPGLVGVEPGPLGVEAAVLVRCSGEAFAMRVLHFPTPPAFYGEGRLVTLRPAPAPSAASVPWERELESNPAAALLVTDSEGRVLRAAGGLLSAGEQAVVRDLPLDSLLAQVALAEVRERAQAEGSALVEGSWVLSPGAPERCLALVLPLGGEPDSYLWFVLLSSSTLPGAETAQLRQELRRLAHALEPLDESRDPQMMSLLLARSLRRFLGPEVLLVHLACPYPLSGEGDTAWQEEGWGGVTTSGLRASLPQALAEGRLSRTSPQLWPHPEALRACFDETAIETLAEAGVLSGIWLPLAVREELLGFVFCGFRAAHTWSPWYEDLLAPYAVALARAVEDSAVTAQERAAQRAHMHLVRTGLHLLPQRDLAALARYVAESTAHFTEARCCWVHLLDAAGEQFRLVEVACEEQEIGPLLEGPALRQAWRAVKSQEPTAEGATLNGAGALQLRSFPLVARGRNWGALTLLVAEPWPEEALLGSALATLAQQTAQALSALDHVETANAENQRLQTALAAVEEESELTRTVLQAVAALSEQGELDYILTRLCRVICDELGFERSRVYLLSEDGNFLEGQMEAEAGGEVTDLSERRSLQAGGDLLADVALGATPYMIFSAPSEEDPTSRPHEQIVVPMRVESDVVGLLAADNPASGREVSAAQTRLLRSLASMAALAISRSLMERARRSMISSVSHELRRPLSSIQAYNGLLLDQDAGPLNAEQQSYAQRIDDSCQRLAEMIDRMLDWSQIRDGSVRVRREPVDLAALVAETVEHLQGRARRADIHLRADTSISLAALRTDPSIVEQVLSNLVDNAIKYNTPGGHVWVRVRSESGQALIEVTDDGPGIPVEYRARVFEEFERGPQETSGHAEGTGLGLAISSRLVKQLGGSLDLATQVGEGCTFTLRLPYGNMRDPRGQEDTSCQEGMNRR